MTNHQTSSRPRPVDLLPSLLWPAGYARWPRMGQAVGSHVVADLDLGPILQILSGGDASREPFVTSILTNLCTYPAVIAYRGDVIDNLLSDPGLRQLLRTLVPTLSTLGSEPERPVYGVEWDAGQIMRRLGSLELFVDGVGRLTDALDDAALHACALRDLREALRVLAGTLEFQDLKAELPALRARIEPVQSVTIGVNLAGDLRPESATILSLDSKRYEGQAGLLHRMLGRDAAARGITPLRGKQASSGRSFFPPMQADPHGLENSLVQDLRRLLEQVTAPIGKAIEEYVWVRTRSFALLEQELSFMLNAVELIERLNAEGLPTCRADIATGDERMSSLDDAYDISLALRMTIDRNKQEFTGKAPIVTNRVSFGETSARVWILTGPNRGGKTTYVRSVGTAHLLFQAGLHVPARRARISPIDAVYTHFPVTETTTVGSGRLDDEAERLADIFREATPNSLILLNEVLSGTSTLDALALATDAVRGLRLLGARAIYVTHLHELAQRCSQINESTPGDGTVASLVAGVDGIPSNGQREQRRTFRIQAQAPTGLSHASEIAQQHGISFEQLRNLLRKRGVLDEISSNGESMRDESAFEIQPRFDR